MKIKIGPFVFLIIICILFSISTVSAGDDSVDAIYRDADYQHDSEINQDPNLDTISEYYENYLNSNSKPNNLKEDSGKNTGTFTQFHDDLISSEGEFNLSHGYTYDEGDKQEAGIFNIDSIVINGNNNVIDGAGSNFYFKFSIKKNGFGENEGIAGNKIHITFNDLTFTNFNNAPMQFGGGEMTFNNVTFTNCSSAYTLIELFGYTNSTLNNCNFYSNSVKNYLRGPYEKLTIYNSNFSGTNCFNSAIEVNRGQLIVENSTFENFNAPHGSIINYKGDYFAIKNSKFMNSNSKLTGGAIIAKYFPLEYTYGDSIIYYHSNNMLIENCTFSNLSSSSNGGAIHLDLDSGSEHIVQTLIVAGCNFTDCRSKFGGALSILGGILNISDSSFKNNNASFEGGAIYSSWTDINMVNSNFTCNIGNQNAGALYFDKGKLTINRSRFIDNKALKESEIAANTIYAHDVTAYFANSTFNNGGVSVYADFADDSKIENIEKNDDIFLMDNHNYIVSVESKGIKLNLTGNEINVDTLPSRFDTRDWGWATPGKEQGDNTDCWAFATTGSLETALAKSTGVLYNLSENYVQKLQLKYFYAGDKRNSLTGFSLSGLGYALSWYGILPVDNEYDARGMIADTDLDVPRIHLQDAMFIYTGMNDTVELIKQAIIKYGAVSVQRSVNEPEEEILTEGDDIAIMSHQTHFISLIGWDENYSEEDGSDDPHSKFAWITRDSKMGISTYHYSNFPDTDYYAIIPQRVAIAYIFENAIDYHVNYQTDLTGLVGFDENYTFYSNEFSSKYDELIGAVGTYFNESGIEYSFDIFVNGVKAHSQNGVSEFAGFRTIILDKYIPIKTGDRFKVVFKSNTVPYQAWSRVHYMNGTSFVSTDGNNWIDFAPLNKTICLKVYTVSDDTKIINNDDIAVDYDGDSYFTVKIVTADGRTIGAGATVQFTINGKTTTAKTDSNGIAKIKVTQLPGKYAITTSYNGKSYKNTVTVRHILKAANASVKNTDKKLVLKATLKINGKAVKGKVIKFTFKGKTYRATTNANGVAKVTIMQSVVKKLTGKSYAFKVAYLKDTAKSSVKVKQILKASKVTVKKSAKKFKLKASLKINGKLAKKKAIKFKLLGKTYKAKTNKKGIAEVAIGKNVMKKLKKGKTYKVKVSYGKDFVITTAKVKK